MRKFFAQVITFFNKVAFIVQCPVARAVYQLHIELSTLERFTLGNRVEVDSESDAIKIVPPLVDGDILAPPIGIALESNVFSVFVFFDCVGSAGDGDIIEVRAEGFSLGTINMFWKNQHLPCYQWEFLIVVGEMVADGMCIDFFNGFDILEILFIYGMVLGVLNKAE